MTLATAVNAPLHAAFANALTEGAALPTDIQYMPPGRHRIRASQVGKAYERFTVAVPGGLAGTVRVKLAGEAYIGSRLQLTNDGRVMTHDNEFPRIIVGVALEAGVTGELIEASLSTATYTPAG
jgi:hypothetical protein